MYLITVSLLALDHLIHFLVYMLPSPASTPDLSSQYSKEMGARTYAEGSRNVTYVLTEQRYIACKVGVR
jgi:hypothetical protein